MMTQTVQPLTTRLGYATPRAFLEAGLENNFRQAMHLASEAYEKLSRFNSEIASYVVPNAFNRRMLFTVNLRSADHLIALRSAPNAHFSIRRAAHRIAQEIRQVTPLLGGYLRESEGETWQDVESKFFVTTSSQST
jgi:thymidylate synthase ThyX